MAKAIFQLKIVSNSRIAESVAPILLLTPARNNSERRRQQNAIGKECICYTFLSAMWNVSFMRFAFDSPKVKRSSSAFSIISMMFALLMNLLKTAKMNIDAQASANCLCAIWPSRKWIMENVQCRMHLARIPFPREASLRRSSTIAVMHNSFSQWHTIWKIR